MTPPLDLAVLAQDPWFGGGARRHLEAFCDAARAVGREPTALYLARGTPHRPGAYRSLLPRVDALNQLLAVRMARAARDARSLWVVASAAHYGAAAPASRRRYACWIGTTLADERRGRLAGPLPRSRRLAARANAPVLDRLERRVLRGAAAVYATSPASARAVAGAGALAPDAVRILPMPVDLERFRPEPDERWRERLDAPLLAFAGRADDPRKNVALLLDAFALLRARVPAARLVLIGRPPTGPLPAGVEAAGQVASVAELLRSAALFVLPSHQEGFGIVVAEALACSVPAVVTPCGGPEHLVTTSGAGVVLGGFDPEELASVAERLLTDRARLLDLRARARPYVEREHSPERLQSILAAAFAELDA
ncbi:MAG: glycosyltransferase family 4 protein [Thermoleophilia bacterium]|nr:glycosyltransferase family 4 protein [Thermoleophilia bacterium]